MREVLARYSLQISGPTKTLPLSPHRPRPHRTSPPLCMPRPFCPHPEQRVQERILLCLLSAPWEEDEIRRDRVEPQSVSLSWREPVLAGAPGTNSTEYEIRYYEKVRPSRKPPRSQTACLPQPYSSAAKPPEALPASSLLPHPKTAPVHFPGLRFSR